MFHAPRDARSGGHRRTGARHRRPQPGHRRDRAPRGRRRRPRDRRLRQRLLSLDQRGQLERHRVWRAHKRGALFANPCFTQIHPTCIPVTGDHQSKLTLMSESLRNDGRVWVPKKKGDRTPAGADPRGRARLLPRTQVSELRQSRAARRRVARRQTGVRRGPRRRRERPGGLSRFRRCHQAARPGDHPGEVRQPLPHVREDHGRGCLQGPDADLPRHPLHDGRPVGGLQPDEQRAGPVRARRGELLRSRRQPARRERADAGPGGRLLHHSVHHRSLPRRHHAAQGHHRSRGVQGSRRLRAAAHQSAARGQGQPGHPRDPPRARPADVGLRRHGAQRSRPAARAGRNPEAARQVLAQRLGPRHAGQPQSEPRIRRPRRRLPGVRRTARPRRAAAPRVVRRALPRREPDARRRSAARRRRASPTSPPGNSPASAASRCCTKSRWSSRKCTRRSGATSRPELQLGRQLGDDRRDARPEGRAYKVCDSNSESGVRRDRPRRADSKTTSPTMSRPTCRSSRCSTSSTKD